MLLLGQALLPLLLSTGLHPHHSQRRAGAHLQVLFLQPGGDLGRMRGALQLLCAAALAAEAERQAPCCSPPAGNPIVHMLNSLAHAHIFCALWRQATNTD